MQASKRGVAARVGRDVLEGLERRPHLGGRLRGEPAEQVVLARGVLVDGDPRAAGQLGDAVERRAVVAGLAERLEGSVEDALVGSKPSRADHRAVCERLPASGGRDDLARRRCAHPVMLRLSNENVNQRDRDPRRPGIISRCVPRRASSSPLTRCAFLPMIRACLLPWSPGTTRTTSRSTPTRTRTSGGCARRRRSTTTSSTTSTRVSRYEDVERGPRGPGDVHLGPRRRSSS